MKRSDGTNKVLIYVLLFCGNYLSAGISFRGDDAFIKVNSGARLQLDRPLSMLNGKIVKMPGGIITGQSISFSESILQDSGNNLLLSAVMNPAGTIQMSGNATLKGERGNVLQSLRVSGGNNRLEGVPLFQQDIFLQDLNTSLTLALQSSLNKNIQLNGGTIQLEDDLRFADLMGVTGSGTVNLNNYRVEFGGRDFAVTSTIVWNSATDITLNSRTTLSSQWTFAGNNNLNGNGNVLDMSPGGRIRIPANSTLFMTDIVIKGLGGTGSINFVANTSRLIMSNVLIELDGNVTTTIGSILVEGPTTWVVKDKTWTFDLLASLTVDGVTLYKDQAGAATAGDIIFTAPLANHLTYVSSGTICYSACGDAENANTALMLAMLKTSTGFLQSQLDRVHSSLRTSTGFLQSQIDRSVSVVDSVRTSTGFLQSQLDAATSSLRTSTGFLQSQIDVLRTTDNLIRTSTGFLQSQIDSNISMVTMLKTSTGFLQSQIDRSVSVVDSVRTSTGFLQSQLDAATSSLRTSTGFLQSQIDVLRTTDNLIRTSTGFLQSQIDSNVSMVTMLKTSTGFLQSQLDRSVSVVDSVRTSTGFLQSQLDNLRVMDDMLKTSTGYLQSQLDRVHSSLRTSTGFLQSQIDRSVSVVDSVRTSTGFLQSQLDNLRVMDDMLKTSTGYLQSQLDRVHSSLRTSTGFLQSQIDRSVSVVDSVRTSTGFLQSQLDNLRVMNDMLKTSTGFLQSQLDAVNVIDHLRLDRLETSTGYLQSQIDVLATSTAYLQLALDQIVRFTYQYTVQGTGADELPDFCIFDAGFKLRNAATVGCLDVVMPVAGTVNLNGGNLVLKRDLILGNMANFVGGGKVTGGGHVVEFAPSMTILGPSLIPTSSFVLDSVVVVLNSDLALSDTLVFQGACTFEGKHNTFDVAQGIMIVDSNASLHIKNTQLKNVSGLNIRCKDDTGKIILDDILWVQSGNYQFSLGALEVRDLVQVTGTNSFVYSSRKTSTIAACSEWHFDAGMTFSYAPITANRDLIEMINETSKIFLHDVNLYSTATGLRLTKGTLELDGECRVFSDALVAAEAISFGDGIAAQENLTIRLLPASGLNIVTGCVIYNNIE